MRVAGLKYRKVSPGTWNDAKFRELDDAGKLVWMLLLTHPLMSALGAMRCTPEGLATELRWTTAKMRRALTAIQERRMAEYDDSIGVIWLPNFLRYNVPESPNVVIAWRGAIDALPEGGLRNRITKTAKDYAEALGEAFLKAFVKAFGEGVSKPLPNPEQEPEQEQEPEPEKPKSAATPLPDWVPPEPWAGYIAMRAKIRKPMTQRAKELAVGELEKLRGQGHDPQAVLEQSIFHSWQGLFPLRPNSSKGGANKQESLEERNRRVAKEWRPPELRDRNAS